MASSPCKLGCTCGRHRPGTTVVYTRTWEHRMRARSLARPDTAERNRQPRSILTRLRAGESIRLAWEEGRHSSENNTGGLRRTSGNFGYSGGDTGDAFAAVLCPVGYVREYLIQYGPDRYDRYKVDFAHLEAKVVIELDGPYHQATKEEDLCRDERLRLLGWKVIRINHD